MCGIAGIVGYRPDAQRVDAAELDRMREYMAVRGPDGAGSWISSSGQAGLAHRRLAIIDPSPAGAQPMASADGRFIVTFNGEIYNYRELKAGLQAKGRVFRSGSDTEVLLALYDEMGPAMVEQLRGMFTFGIWDERKRELFLARDPFGIKPLYYADNGNTFRFASQVKALRAGGSIGSDPEPAGHVGFFIFGSVPEPFTLFREIRALPAGHHLVLSADRGARLKRYFDPAEVANGAAARGPAAHEPGFLARCLRETVAHHMIADVPVGVFLSSGLDSSTVAALACEVAGSNLQTVTLGFEEYRNTTNDETPLAGVTARQLKTKHVTRWTKRDEFEQAVNHIMHAMDQPSIDGVNTYFVSKAAAEVGLKVALSGLGGDELFGGYPSFQDVPRLARMRLGRSHRMGRLLRQITAPVLQPFVSPKYASVFEYGGSLGGAYLLRRALHMPWEARRFMDTRFFDEGWQSLDLVDSLELTAAGVSNERQKVSVLEMSWYMRNQLLRDADWAGMAHSLEIRVPFVDSTLYRQVAPMMASPKAPTKRDAAMTPAKGLPAELLNRPKTGFSIPVHQWARPSRSFGGPQRQLRAWSHMVYEPYNRLRALVLVSDAFGGHGGIALYNRDLLASLCAMPECVEVVALPRLISRSLEEMPAKLDYRREAANGKWSYAKSLIGLLFRDARFDLLICCHINLLPLAYLAKLRTGAPLLTFIYGIDAWSPQNRWRQSLLRHVDRFVSISEVTRRKFQLWSHVRDDRITILPNAIHSEWYGAGPRNPELLAGYGLEGKVVLMTLGRLVSSERYKGFDEVMEAMPALLKEIPNLAYLIVGDGSDKARLADKAARLGLLDHVRFTGMISEAEKADHYRLADAFVMPSRGEGFGFVLLEAMACGIPAVASAVDGGREALRDGRLGILVDPDNLEDVRRGVREALRQGRGTPPSGLDFFDFSNFSSRTHSLVQDAVALTDRHQPA